MIKLYNGDSAEVLKQLPENSIDSIVTDPPAAIAFMSKTWDGDKGGRQQWIDWLAGIMQECLRVLKPGGHAFVWSLPRTSHWAATALEDAGFEIRDVVAHLQSQGFPKSMSISKAIDKHLNKERPVIGLRPDAAKLNKSVQESQSGWVTSTRHPELTASGCDESAKWEGWGTALKPSSEFWILCRKPLSEKTVASNVLKWNTGAINIEDCRVSTTDNLNGGAHSNTLKDRDDGWGMKTGGAGEYVQPSGRWPANCVLTHSKIPIMTLADNLPNELLIYIRRYFDGYTYMQALSTTSRDNKFQDQSRTKILQQEMQDRSIQGESYSQESRDDLSGVSKEISNLGIESKKREREILQQEMQGCSLEVNDGRKIKTLGKETHRRSEDENVEIPHGETNKRKSSSLERWQTNSDLQINNDRHIAGGSETNSKTNETDRDLHIGTPTDSSLDVKKTIEERRSSTSQKWRQTGQSPREFNSNGLGETFQESQNDRKATIDSYSKGRTSGSGKQKIEILACHIPEKLMKFFKPTGYFYGCTLEGTMTVKSGVAVNENRDPKKSKTVYGDFNNMQGANQGYGDETVEKWNCVDGCPVKLLNEQSGTLKSGTGAVKKKTSAGYQANAYGKESRDPGTPCVCYGDEGGASRFFKTFEPFIYKSKASQADRNAGLTDMKNTHPTLKSTKLMEYFITMITPPGGIVLDPFMGSGSTGLAAIKNGFGFVGIEMDENYFKIAEGRIHGCPAYSDCTYPCSQSQI